MKILVVELWNIGDVVLTLPFLSQLRETFPGATVTLLGQKHAGEVLEGTGLVDGFIEARLDWKREDRGWLAVAGNARGFLRTVRELRARKFDVMFQARPHVREYVLAGLSGARRRIGLARKGWDTLLTDVISDESKATQRSSEWLRLLDPFGGEQRLNVPKLTVFDDERKFAGRFLESAGVEPHRLVGMHPGASVVEKRWPLERFAEVAEQLAAVDGVQVLVFVDPAGYGASLGNVKGVTIARVGLREMMALLERCRVLVCNDSGPMHLAAALGIPTAAIFGTGISDRFAPLGGLNEPIVAEGLEEPQVPATRAHPYASVALVSPEAVLAAVRRVLAGRTAGSSDPREARILLDHARR